MKRAFVTLMLLAALAPQATAEPVAEADSLTRLLDDFLAGASRGDPAVHESFWAEDLVYTSSAGKRMGKADILRDVTATEPRKRDEPVTKYTAEDIRIRQYGNAAVMAFRLIATTTTTEAVSEGRGTEVREYFNTATFVRREGKWQAVAWQATVIPRPENSPGTR